MGILLACVFFWEPLTNVNAAVVTGLAQGIFLLMRSWTAISHIFKRGLGELEREGDQYKEFNAFHKVKCRGCFTWNVYI